jgi:hypothetical protein
MYGSYCKPNFCIKCDKHPAEIFSFFGMGYYSFLLNFLWVLAPYANSYAASIILTHFTLQPLAYSTIKKPCASLKTQGHLTVVHPDLNIQIGHTQRVLFNKGAARLDIITHQTREHVISIDGIIDGDP